MGAYTIYTRSFLINFKYFVMRLTRKFFASKFPAAKQCASCRFFHSDVTIEELEEQYEDFVKDNICLFTNGYSFPCQYRSVQPPIGYDLRMPLKNKN